MVDDEGGWMLWRRVDGGGYSKYAGLRGWMSQDVWIECGRARTRYTKYLNGVCYFGILGYKMEADSVLTFAEDCNCFVRMIISITIYSY